MALGPGEALALTLAVEVPIVALVAGREKVPLGRALIAALLASSLSHPAAWALALRLGPDDYLFGAFAIEAVVVVFEAGVLAIGGGFRLLAAAIASTLANAASAMIGYVVQA